MNLQIEHGLSDENEYDFFRLRFISSIGISIKYDEYQYREALFEWARL